MKPRCRSLTGARLIAWSMAAGLPFCAAIASSDAADRSGRSVESGQPRDLINRPDCWDREHSEEWYRCAAAMR